MVDSGMSEPFTLTKLQLMRIFVAHLNADTSVTFRSRLAERSIRTDLPPRILFPNFILVRSLSNLLADLSRPRPGSVENVVVVAASAT